MAHPALRCSEMYDRRTAPALKHGVRDLRHVTAYKTHMTPVSSVVAGGQGNELGWVWTHKERWGGPGEGCDEPLFCGWFPEKVYGMEDYTVTETG